MDLWSLCIEVVDRSEPVTGVGMIPSFTQLVNDLSKVDGGVTTAETTRWPSADAGFCSVLGLPLTALLCLPLWLWFRFITMPHILNVPVVI